MEIKIKEYKMKKLVLFLVLLFSMIAFSQSVDAPYYYTPYLALPFYHDGDTAGADSLNHVNTKIDNFAKASNDSLNTLKTRVNTVINYGSGGIIDGTVTWNDLSTSAKASIVQVTGTQNIAGNKTVTDNWYMDAIYPNDDNTYNLGKKEERWKTVYATKISTGGLSILNSAGSDSATVTYENKTMNFPGIKVTADTIVGLTATSAYQEGTTISNVNDSLLSIPYCNSYQILLPGANMPKVETISMRDLPSGSISHELIIWINPAMDYNILFKDMDSVGSTDGNLQLAGDFNMDAGDILKLVWLSDYNSGTWLEVSRSDNR